MRKKKAYFKSLKKCENIHVFMESWYGVKSHHRKKTRFNHNDMPIYLLNRGITPPVSVSFAKAAKDDSNNYVYVRDDDNNIRCYRNDLSLRINDILHSNLKAQERYKKRREILRSMGYDYNEKTGEVELLEELEEEIFLDSLDFTEKVNRNNQHNKIYSYGRRK